MIVIQMMGGLGNQLQQYAFYQKLKKCGIETKIDTSWYRGDNQKNMAAPRELELRRLQGVSFEEASWGDVVSLIGGNGLAGKVRRRFLPNSIKVFEENSRIFVPEIYEGIINNRSVKELYTKAHFACEYYYADILEDLRNEITFPIEKAASYRKIAAASQVMKSSNSVAVHLRRGDYLDPINAQYYGGICTEEYYENAISCVIEKAGADSFYIFSDDLAFAQDFRQKILTKYQTINTKADSEAAYEADSEAVYEVDSEAAYVADSEAAYVADSEAVYEVDGVADRENAQETYKKIGIRAEVIDINHGNDSMFDIYLMSCCRHNITANSTFSFWGARFNPNSDKIMIRPTKHINQQPFVIEDMRKWWKGWTFISPDGHIYE